MNNYSDYFITAWVILSFGPGVRSGTEKRYLGGLGQSDIPKILGRSDNLEIPSYFRRFLCPDLAPTDCKIQMHTNSTKK